MSPSPDLLSPKLKMLGPLCNQIVNLKTDSQNSVVKFAEIKVYSFCCKAQQRLKEICVVKKQPQKWLQKSYKQDILQKHLQSAQSMFASYGTHAIKCFASLRIFIRQGCRTQR